MEMKHYLYNFKIIQYCMKLSYFFRLNLFKLLCNLITMIMKIFQFLDEK